MPGLSLWILSGSSTVLVSASLTKVGMTEGCEVIRETSARPPANSRLIPASRRVSACATLAESPKSPLRMNPPWSAGGPVWVRSRNVNSKKGALAEIVEAVVQNGRS
eukprot:Gregarina_sp_Poly_1__11479@NODE_989_length_5454_cov_5_659922_g695_i0_p4_GENE_NODE_989_length_5454_cov_5_659922_g695_i0NODE_989_length_5454_cov_5_659922_g695_i0_p4_ORF_typecomplete_len107_score5_18NRD1_2/PF01995_16/0_044_NODE_989_length_5454_cov_5_659922_g695_i035813901